MRPGMSVRPPPSMTVTLASAGGWIVALETRSMMFPRTITLLGSVSFSALPSKIRTFLNRVTATLGAAVAAPAAPGPAGGDDTVAGGVVVAAPVAAPPASDPDGAPDGAQPAESMSTTMALRNRTLSRMKASLAGFVSRNGPFECSQRDDLSPTILSVILRQIGQHIDHITNDRGDEEKRIDRMHQRQAPQRGAANGYIRCLKTHRDR